MLKRRIYRAFTAIFTISTLAILSTGQIQAQDGETLFKANCASCHKIDKRLVGPALAGVEDRWEEKDALYAWIKNSTQYLKDNPGDGYANKLFDEYNGSVMPAQAVTDADIDAILAYVANPPQADVPVTEPTAAGSEVPTEDYTMWWLLAIAIFLIFIIGAISGVKSSMKRAAKDVVDGEQAEEVGEDRTLFEAFLHFLYTQKKTVAAIVLVILATASVQGWFVAKDIGVYQGYAPEQPIKFSHKIHAGDNEIACVYCHHSAEKGKTAGIPSVNVCMNCHKGVQEGSLYGETEIAKIHDAAGFDASTGQYTKEPKPIEWVRIHNLPDHAYFNHSQHVIVGEQECQTCHGPVEEIGYPMYQHAPLTMGWCINCHRETEVAMEGNAYYDEIHKQLLEKYKDDGIEEFTVEHIGGTECAKCHY